MELRVQWLISDEKKIKLIKSLSFGAGKQYTVLIIALPMQTMTAGGIFLFNTSTLSVYFYGVFSAVYG